MNTLNNRLSIAWVDLTFVAPALLCRKEKIILRGISGHIEFGSLNALMGPSGAGKTTLLRCINGKNKSGLVKESKIYLSAYEKIRTCFIAQYQNEHLLSGLTAKQNLIYASKLKNSDSYMKVDHEKNAMDLMSELMISDIANTNIENCSGGEQKRLAIALELTSVIKPNLICIDEPTSGLDSNAAEVVIECLKILSQTHNISIITSIHQPNSEVLMMFDKLYILAKGGICVFSGHPQDLKSHLSECQIICSGIQVPIEVILKVSSKGINDQQVLRLADKTSQNKSQILLRIKVEAELYPDGIELKSENFKLIDTWNLLIRCMNYSYISQWKPLLIQFLCYLIFGFNLTLLYNSDIGKPDGCFTLNSNSSSKTTDSLREQSLLDQNMKFNFFAAAIVICLQIMGTTLTFPSEVKIFFNEHQNGWYSTGAYYWAKSTTELIPTIITVVCYVGIVYFFSGQIEDERRFFGYLFIMIAGMLCAQGIGFIVGISVCNNDKLAVVMAISVNLVILIFCNFYIPVNELHESLQWFSYVSIFKLVFEAVLTLIYGFDRCPSGQLSIILYQFELKDDNVFWTNSCFLILHFICLRCLALIILIIRANSISLTKFKQVNIRNSHSRSTLYASTYKIPELISYKNFKNIEYPQKLEVSHL